MYSIDVRTFFMFFYFVMFLTFLILTFNFFKHFYFQNVDTNETLDSIS